MSVLVVLDAAARGNLLQLQSLLTAHPHLIDTKEGQSHITPLYAAASDGQVAAIDFLVRQGSKAIDTPARYGWTPMHAAAMSGHVSVIETLVRLGSKAIDTPNDDGWTPMYYAAWSDHASVVEALVRLGSNAIDIPNNGGFTPLHAAAHHGHTSVIEALIRLGSKSIDTLDKYGDSPLRTAIQTHCFQAARVLKALGANADISTFIFNTQEIEQLRATVPEEEVAEVRYRVYFGGSLVHRLLFELDQHDVFSKASIVHTRTELRGR